MAKSDDYWIHDESYRRFFCCQDEAQQAIDLPLHQGGAICMLRLQGPVYLVSVYSTHEENRPFATIRVLSR